MSQIYKVVSSEPSVADQYVTDSGTAVPVANILNVVGNETTANNNNGIETTGAGNTVTVLLTNRLQGSTTTVGAVNGDIITFPLGVVAGTYTFEFKISSFEATNPASGGYAVAFVASTTGAAATVLGNLYSDALEDAPIMASSIDLDASVNSVILRVTGVVGLTINWSAVGSYTFVS